MADQVWKVEVRDAQSDKTKSTCLAFIDVPSYREAMQIRENLQVEWDFNGKIDAKRYDTLINPSLDNAPEMWFYMKPKLGEKTPIISRKDNTLEQCLSYRNPMTKGQAVAGRPNHGFFVLKPRLMKGIVRSHKETDGLDRPFGSVFHSEGNFKDKHKKVHGRGGDTDRTEFSSWDNNTGTTRQENPHYNHEYGSVDNEFIKKSLTDTGVAPELLKQKRGVYNKQRAAYGERMKRQEKYEET
jgi:hypothetical protein